MWAYCSILSMGDRPHLPYFRPRQRISISLSILKCLANGVLWSCLPIFREITSNSPSLCELTSNLNIDCFRPQVMTRNLWVIIFPKIFQLELCGLHQLVTFFAGLKPSGWMLRGRFSFQRYKFGPYFTTSGPSIRTNSAVHRSLHPPSEILKKVSGPWILAFPFKTLDQFGRPWIPASPFKFWTFSAVLGSLHPL